jgi:hypothetical protein
MREYSREWKRKNKESIRGKTNESARLYRARKKAENQELWKQKKADEYQKYKAKASDRQKEYYQKNKDAIRKYQESYREQHRKEIRELALSYYYNGKTDPVFYLKRRARGTIRDSFQRRKYQKSKHTEELTGLSSIELCQYLLTTFKNNYGRDWDGKEPVHIDHIIPLATAKSEEDVIRLCHYSNLQLLTAQDNLMKGSKYAESKTVEIRREKSPAD